MVPSADLAYRPDHVIAPGATLRDRLAEIDVSQAELALRAGLSPKHVNQIVQGQASITPETALILERVTGTPARIWSALESRYRQAKMREQARTLSPEDVAWVDSLPTASLQKMGYLPSAIPRGELFEALLSFFGVADRAAWERLWLQPVASFKRATAFKSDGPIVATWLRLGELDARDIKTASFNASDFRAALSHIRGLTRAADFSAELVAACAKAGVALVFVREIGGERASGASRWLSASRALIQLSDRYKREDHFWFAFFHEAAHVLLHSKKQTFIHDGSEDPRLEGEANRFASDVLIPRSQAHRLPHLTTTSDVLLFADEIGIAPGIVVGRLQHDHFWSWKRGNDLRAPVRIVSSDR